MNVDAKPQRQRQDALSFWIVKSVIFVRCLFKLAIADRQIERKVAPYLNLPVSRSTLTLTEVERTQIALISKALGFWSQVFPNRFRCVHRSYVLCEWLRARGKDATICIGWPTGSGRSNDSLKWRYAHAWVELGSEVVGDQNELHKDYLRFERASPSNGVTPRSAIDEHARQMIATKELLRVTSGLGAVQVHYLYLKGLSYDIPAANAQRQVSRPRAFADIDLLVNPKDLQRVDVMLKGLGYDSDFSVSGVRGVILKLSNFNHVTYRSATAVFPIEVHWRLKEAELCHGNSGHLLSKSYRSVLLSDQNLNVGAPVQLFFHAVLHGVRDGFGRRKHVEDVYKLFAGLDDTLHAQVVELARLMRIEAFVGAALILVSEETPGFMIPPELASGSFADTRAHKMALSWRMRLHGAKQAVEHLNSVSPRSIMSLGLSFDRKVIFYAGRYCRLLFSLLFVILQPSAEIGFQSFKRLRQGSKCARIGKSPHRRAA